MGVRWWVMIAVLGGGLALPSGSNAATPVSVELRPTDVAAFGGRVVWSSYDATTGRFELRTWANGVVSRVPVAARKVPFDVDLGPTRGGTTAVYSRCARESRNRGRSGLPEYAAGRGCRLYGFTFGTGRERPLAHTSHSGASQYLPAIWGRSVVYAAVGGAMSRSYVPRLFLTSLSRGATQRLPGGSVGRYTRSPMSTRYIGGPGPTSTDLYRSTVAFTSEYLPRTPCHAGARSELIGSELWIVRGRRARLLRRRCEPTTFSAASISAGAVNFVETSGSDRFRWFFSRIARGELARDSAPDGVVSAVTDATGTYFVARADGRFVVYRP